MDVGICTVNRHALDDGRHQATEKISEGVEVVKLQSKVSGDNPEPHLQVHTQ